MGERNSNRRHALPAAAAAVAVATVAEAFAVAVAFAAFFVAMVFASPPIRAQAYEIAQQPVRVGIRAAGIQDAGSVDGVRLYSERGLMAEWADGQGNVEQLVRILFVSKASELSVKKHWHSARFAVRAKPKPDGPSSYAEAAWLLADLEKKGYSCVLEYSARAGDAGGGAAGLGSWHALIGAFDSAAAADAYIDASLGSGFAGVGFEAADMSAKYISATLDGKLQFVCAVADGGGLRFSPQDGARVAMDGKAYRGAIELLRISDSDMTVVNVLPMDEYLYGVVPREIQASSHLEALKAQAVAARTYTVNSRGRHSQHGFNLCGTTHCQVYGGADGEDERASRAVDETSGQVVLYKGAPAQVFYFSSSGGRTEDVANVWGSSYPYLVSVEDPYESGDSAYYNWEATYTAKEISAQLQKSGDGIGEVLDVAVTRRSEAGRAVEVTVTGAAGTKVYSNELCRTFLGGLRSQAYTITGGGGLAAVGTDGTAKAAAVEGRMAVSSAGVSGLAGAASELYAASASGVSKLAERQGASFRFVGKGWGHAVGMSQEGAKGMASAGFGYNDILTHYFPGCTVG